MNETRNNRIKILKEYLAEDSEDHFSRYALALEVIEIGETDEAIRLLSEVISQNADFLAAYYKLGRAFEISDQKENAVQVYKQGIKIACEQKKSKTESELKAALLSLQDEDDI